MASGSVGSTQIPQSFPSITSRHIGKSDATTGSPQAMYSKSLVGPAFTWFGSGRKHTMPASARTSCAGSVS